MTIVSLRRAWKSGPLHDVVRVAPAEQACSRSSVGRRRTRSQPLDQPANPSRTSALGLAPIAPRITSGTCNIGRRWGLFLSGTKVSQIASRLPRPSLLSSIVCCLLLLLRTSSAGPQRSYERYAGPGCCHARFRARSLRAPGRPSKPSPMRSCPTITAPSESEHRGVAGLDDCPAHRARLVGRAHHGLSSRFAPWTPGSSAPRPAGQSSRRSSVSPRRRRSAPRPLPAPSPAWRSSSPSRAAASGQGMVENEHVAGLAARPSRRWTVRMSPCAQRTRRAGPAAQREPGTTWCRVDVDQALAPGRASYTVAEPSRASSA